MMKYSKIFIFVFLLIILYECGDKNNKNSVSMKSDKNYSKVGEYTYENNKNLKKSKIENKYKVVWKNNKKYIVYTIKKGDTIWSIARDYIKQIKGENYTKKDIGNMFYLINKINFRDYPGGVKNKLKIGEKILLPE